MYFPWASGQDANRQQQRRRSGGGPSGESHWFDEAAAGARHIFRSAILRQVTIATTIAVFVVGFMDTVMLASPSQHGCLAPLYRLDGQASSGLAGDLTIRSGASIIVL